LKIELGTIPRLTAIGAPVVIWTMHDRATGRRATCVLVHIGPEHYAALVNYSHRTSVAAVTFATQTQAELFATNFSRQLVKRGRAEAPVA